MQFPAQAGNLQSSAAINTKSGPVCPVAEGALQGFFVINKQEARVMLHHADPASPSLRLRRVGWATSVASWRATCLGIGSGGGCVQSPLHPNKRLSCLLVRVLEPAMDNTDYTSDERHGRTLSLISPSEAARGIDWSNWEPLLSAFAEGQKRQNWPPVHKNSAIGTPAAYAYKREALFWTIQRDSGKERTLWLLGSSRSCLLSPKSAVV